ncbi:MAG: hypothetical protein ABID84_05905 [Chloroflexota bacterium]
MNTKSFVSLMIAVLMLGGSLGGAFVGGIALGKSQAEKAPSSSAPLSSDSSSQQPDQTSQEQLDEIRQWIQSGQLDTETRDQLRQQLQGQFGQGGIPGLPNRGGLTGTIEKVEGNTVTVNTPQGPLRATIGADTTIQMSVEGTVEDLATGTQVTVVGQPGEDGTVQATSIVLVPEGSTGFLGSRR